MHPIQRSLRESASCGIPVATWILAVALLTSIARQVSAVPVFDPFIDATVSGGTSYSIGANLVGQTNSQLIGWYVRNSGAGSGQPAIVVGNLSYPNMPASSGNSISFSPGASPSACFDMGVASQHSATAFYSFMLKITDISTVPTTPSTNPIAMFLDDPTAALGGIARRGARLLTKRITPTTYVLGIGRADSATEYVYEPDAAAHNVGDVLFVVGSHQRFTGQTNVFLWVNPPASSLGSNTPPAPTLVAPYPTTVNGGLNNNNARAFGIICQFPEAPTGVIDDVRVATNDWAFITGGNPAVVSGPTNRAVPPGNNVSFSITARGTPTLTYQWVKDGSIVLADGGNISGSHSNVLSISAISAGDLGTYTAYVTNGLSAFAQSPTATLSFQTDPSITNQPQSVARNFGSNATFTVGASGTAPVSYQWHKDGFGDLNDGGNISGSHSNVLAIGNLAYPDSGNYYVTVSNALGTVDSVSASLIVADPYISIQPVSVTTNAGGTVAFHADGVGSPSLIYQWLKNGGIIFDNAVYSGATTTNLTVSNTSASEQANYSLRVEGPFSNAISSVATLTVLSPASVAIQPRSRAVLAGVKVGFAVGAGGSGPFTYQWQRNGSDIGGATTSTYMVTNAQLAVVGDYRVVISNSFSSATSTLATLTVSNNLSLAETNLIIVRVGDGANTLNVNGSSMFIEQYAPDGTYVNTITIPDDGPTALTTLGWDNINGVNNGATTGTTLSQSLDARFMSFAGYNTNLNYGASLGGSVAAAVPRGIGLIDSFGQYTLAMASTNPIYDANQSFWRTGITDGTNNFWGGSASVGTYYFGFDAPASLIQTTFINTRSVELMNGDLYCVTAATPTGVLKINGMPTSNVGGTLLFNASSGSYDLAVNATGDVIYLTDQRAIGNGGGIQRWEFNGTSWNLAYTLNTGFGGLGPRYIVADFSGVSPVLYVTANDQTFDNNRLLKVVDNGGSATVTALASAGANQTFRGIRFGPVPNTVVQRPLISFTRDGNSNLILSWSGSFTLMSSTNVVGPYVDVGGATSPYTNNAAGAQRFFGLRQ